MNRLVAGNITITNASKQSTQKYPFVPMKRIENPKEAKSPSTRWLMKAGEMARYDAERKERNVPGRKEGRKEARKEWRECGPDAMRCSARPWPIIFTNQRLRDHRATALHWPPRVAPHTSSAPRRPFELRQAPRQEPSRIDIRDCQQVCG